MLIMYITCVARPQHHPTTRSIELKAFLTTNKTTNKKGILSKRSTPQLRGSSETTLHTPELKGHVITTQLKGNFNTMLHTILLLRGNLSTSNSKQQVPRSAIAVHVVSTSIRVL